MKTILKNSFIYLFTFFSSASLYAQSYSRIQSGVDATFGKGKDRWAAIIHYQQFLNFPRFKGVQVGWGIRGTQIGGKNTDFTSAPASLSKSATTIDTLQLPRFTATNIGFSLGVQVTILNRLDIGANTDLLSLAIGGKRTGTYLSSIGYNKVDTLNLHKTAQNAAPTKFGTQSIGDRQVGNLQSEVYARLHLSDRFAIKIGYLFTTNEYTADKALIDDNKRFRSRAQMIQAGITFRVAN